MLQCLVKSFFAVKQNKGMPITVMGALEKKTANFKITQIVDHKAQRYKLRDY
jgi:hypothetical protein